MSCLNVDGVHTMCALVSIVPIGTEMKLTVAHTHTHNFRMVWCSTANDDDI